MSGKQRMRTPPPPGRERRLSSGVDKRKTPQPVFTVRGTILGGCPSELAEELEP
jgi:hypothetical protein